MHADISFLALVYLLHQKDLLIMKPDVVIPNNNHQLSTNWILKHFLKSPDIICPCLQKENEEINAVPQHGRDRRNYKYIIQKHALSKMLTFPMFFIRWKVPRYY